MRSFVRTVNGKSLCSQNYLAPNTTSTKQAIVSNDDQYEHLTTTSLHRIAIKTLIPFTCSPVPGRKGKSGFIDSVWDTSIQKIFQTRLVKEVVGCKIRNLKT